MLKMKVDDGKIGFFLWKARILCGASSYEAKSLYCCMCVCVSACLVKQKWIESAVKKFLNISRSSVERCTDIKSCMADASLRKWMVIR